MPQKYQIGQEVFSILPPFQKLVIINYRHQVYYCNLEGSQEQAAQVYYEGELRNKR